MASINSQRDRVQLQQQAHQCLIQGDYTQAASFYEQSIEAEPEVKRYYWNLGLMLLLQGQEAEAHTTWLLGMVDGEPEQVEEWTVELIEVLKAEAERREVLQEPSVAWLIRQHIREIIPTDINNLLHLLPLSVQIEKFTGEDLKDWGVIKLLNAAKSVELNDDLLKQGLQSVLEADPLHPASLEFVEAIITHVQNSHALFYILLIASLELAHSRKRPDLAARLAELYLRREPDNLECMRHLAGFYQNAFQYQESIKTAKLCFSFSQELADKISANHLILRGLLGEGGSWEEAFSVFQRHKSLLLSLIESYQIPLEQIIVSRLFTCSFFAPYFKDDPRDTRQIQNTVAQLCQANVRIYAQEPADRYKQQHLQRKKLTSTKPLKIGYLSSCLRRHSVGWLVRGLFQHYDRERFQIYGYFLNPQPIQDPLQEWYVSQIFQSYHSIDSFAVAEQISQDEIDILIDLDSITLDINCEILALKPAPVQITWLGWDASGIPAVDYFIADPYVLPDYAQDYYAEKIWRLPQTYIAVDGFEVGVPTSRRDQLDIPNDAVVYFSGQRGFKRHPDTVRLQMRILKEVLNSYFLIKGIGDEDAIKSFFTQIAEEEGVDTERLKFLPLVNFEAVHRANLGIADVVLDTYPYNGATTTMETLWMGIPMVTRVGEQFAARNSYTMMINAGITEGIAWTDEEYVKWGIRLGKEPALRQEIAWKLWQSRKTSPLWNAKQFTREMEKAYEQMWEKYLQGY